MVKGAKAEWGMCSRTVLLDTFPRSLSYQKNIIAIGCGDEDIITLDAITGSRMAVLSGHTDGVNCVTFSSDGRSLASGADDKTVKLWDIQSGGIIRTFLGHTQEVLSVSISMDYTRIISGSSGGEVYLWDIQTGECLWNMKQKGLVGLVCFSPVNPQHIICIYGEKVWEWDLNGQQIPLTYNGTHMAISPDCTEFALCNQDVITVQDSTSGATKAQFHITAGRAKFSCFSPDGRLIAAAASSIAYVWDITSTDTLPMGTLVGHYAEIRSLIFSSTSSLVSISLDCSVRFWQIGVLPTSPIVAVSEFTPPALSIIQSVSLHARTGIAISSDKKGVVKIWDISTGLCKLSFQTPVGYNFWRDTRLKDDKLTVVWCKHNQLYIWDTNNDGSPKIAATLSSGCMGLRISGDGSKVFCLSKELIQAWFIHTREPVGEVKLELEQEFYLDPLQMDDSKIWIRLNDTSTKGWDFGVPNSLPVPLSDGPMGRPLLDLISGPSWQIEGISWIKNTATGKEVFQFSGRYAKPNKIQWDGQYLVAGYESGEVLILAFHHMYPQ